MVMSFTSSITPRVGTSVILPASRHLVARSTTIREQKRLNAIADYAYHVINNIGKYY